MPPSEIPLTLSPQQAATGLTLTLPLPSGPIRLRVPPGTRDGDLVRARAGDQEVLLRIRIAGSTASTPPAPPRPAGTSNRAQRLGLLAVAGMIVVLVLLATGTIGGSTDSSDTSDSANSSDYTSSSPTYTSEPYETSNPYGTSNPDETSNPDGTSDPYETGDPYETSYPYGTGDPYPTQAPRTEAPSPYTSGTCLNGTLPDSTTAQEVSGVDEVSCDASDAHYKVIESIPLTSDMSRCNDNPRTQYAFSSRYTINGATINEYVYCLVGLGSYAR